MRNAVYFYIISFIFQRLHKFNDVVWHLSWSFAGNILAVSGGDNTVRKPVVYCCTYNTCTYNACTVKIVQVVTKHVGCSVPLL